MAERAFASEARPETGRGGIIRARGAARRIARRALRIGAALLPAAQGLACGPAFAEPNRSDQRQQGQEVVLRLKSSDFEIGGQLRSYDGRRYIVATAGFGDLSLDAASYACVSGACRGVTSAEGTGAGTDGTDAGTAGKPTMEFAEASDKAAARIVIDGAPALEADLLPALVRGYARHLGGTARQFVGLEAATNRFRITDGRGAELADITINRRASRDVFAALGNGTATLGATTRAAGATEVPPGAPPGLARDLAASETVIGLDGIAVIVAPGHPAERLPAATVARILAGEVKDWGEVGLPAGPIRVYAGTEQMPEGLAATLGRPQGLTLSAAASRIADEAELSDAVARDPSGIGIASLTQLRNARSLDIVLGCGLTARASDFAVKTEEYPLVRRLYLYSVGQPKEPIAQDLVRYTVSAAAQPAIRAGGLVDQSIVAAPEADERARLADAQRWTRGGPAALALLRQLTTDVGEARRLSTTFRFKLNSAELDAKSQGDIVRLAALLRQPAYQGKVVTLAGFTDASGRADTNAALSLKRANEVREALLAAIAQYRGIELAPGEATTGQDAAGAAVRIEARGYGPAAPVACNGGVSGQHRNRRVEVWLKDGGAATASPQPSPQPAAAAVGPAEVRGAAAPKVARGATRGGQLSRERKRM